MGAHQCVHGWAGCTARVWDFWQLARVAAWCLVHWMGVCVRGCPHHWRVLRLPHQQNSLLPPPQLLLQLQRPPPQRQSQHKPVLSMKQLLHLQAIGLALQGCWGTMCHEVWRRVWRLMRLRVWCIQAVIGACCMPGRLTGSLGTNERGDWLRKLQ